MQRLVTRRAAGLAARAARASVPRVAYRGLASEVPLHSGGGLRDEDRIYQNLYSQHDYRLKGALVC